MSIHPLTTSPLLIMSAYYVDVPEETRSAMEAIETVAEAIEVYLQAFRQKFHSQENRKQRGICLRYFLRYLVAHQHSMKLRDLTTNDGRGFIYSLVNHYNGLPLKPSEIKKYRTAIRSFSRFLHQMGLLEENIFLPIKTP